MGSISNFAENAFINHLLGTAYTPTVNLYMALCTADPGDTATGAACSEVPNAVGYTRTLVTFNAAASRQVVQAADITFNAVSGSVSNIGFWVITDSATYGAGNVLATGSFNSVFSLVSGNALRIPAGALIVSLASNATTGMTNYAAHAMLNHMFRNVAFSSPAASIYLALLTSNCLETYTTMAEASEVTGSAYSRLKINQPGGSTPAWATIANGSTSNAAAASFATPTGAWTTITAMAIVTALSGTAANILFYDNSLSDQTPASGDLVYYPISTLTVAVS